MADESVPVQYPNTAATTTAPVSADRQPPFTQETHPSTTASGTTPEVHHTSDHDDDTQNRANKER